MESAQKGPTEEQDTAEAECCTAAIGRRIEQYLEGVSRELARCHNPRLLEEQQRLLSLLHSYRRLCLTVTKDPKKPESKAPQQSSLRSEIYSLLQPELFRDSRPASSVPTGRRRFEDPRLGLAPRTTAPRDPRAREKERLTKALASSPAPLARPSAPRRSRQQPIRVRDTADREAEKDRLATLFATDSASKRPVRPRISTSKAGAVREGGSVAESEAQSRRQALVNKEQRRRKMLELKKKEYQELVHEAESGKADKAVLAREVSLLGTSQASSPRSVSSVATQTEQEEEQMTPSPKPTPKQPAASNPFIEAESPFITSPRAKLIKDLHGVSPCLPGASPLLTLPDGGGVDERVKQMLYAEALRAQIEEKRRLEDERRRKEAEEEEAIERRARQHQERLREEYDREQSLKNSWLVQKQAQEETLRQRLVEMELEAKEAKRRFKVGQGIGGEPPSPPPVTPPPPLTPRVVQELIIPRTVQEVAAAPPPPTDQITPIPDSPRPRPTKLNFANGHQMTEEESKEGRQRAPSPVLPALQTDSILRRSPFYLSPRTIQDDKEDLLRGDKILTQLGLFRKELELEQERLQKRVQQQS